MTDEEKKEFEEFLKWKAEKAEKAQKESATTETVKEPIKVDVNANVNASITPSVNMNWYQKLTVNQKYCLMAYVIWFVVHVLLLVSGKGRDGFFPRLYKDYDWWHQYTMPTTRAGMEKFSWALEWEIKMYGFPEFIVYVILIPVVILFIYILLKNNKKVTSCLSNK